MPEVFWEEELGISLRNILGDIYEGLPIDEPSFTLKYIIMKHKTIIEPFKINNFDYSGITEVKKIIEEVFRKK